MMNGIPAHYLISCLEALKNDDGKEVERLFTEQQVFMTKEADQLTHEQCSMFFPDPYTNYFCKVQDDFLLAIEDTPSTRAQVSESGTEAFVFWGDNTDSVILATFPDIIQIMANSPQHSTPHKIIAMLSVLMEKEK
jgi:hypothetical protein